MSIRLGLFVIYIFGIHSRLRLFDGEQLLVPFVISFLIGMIFLTIHLPKYLHKNALPIFYLIGFFAISIIFGPNKMDALILREKFLGFIQIATSILISYAVFWELKKYSLAILSKLFLSIIIFILTGSLIEIFSSFKFIMEDFMRPLYPPDAFYYSIENIQRDISYYLFYRPKFLTSEPSYVGETISMLILFWRLSTNLQNKNLIYILLLFISFLIVRSPVILTLVPIYFLINIFLEKKETYWKSRNFKFTSFLLIIIFSLISYNIMKERIEQASFGLDNSLTMRIIAPTYITYEVLSQYPLFGVGIAAKESTENIILDKFSQLGLAEYFDSNNIGLSTLINKNHSYTLKFLTYFGILGTAFIILLLNRVMFICRVENLSFIYITFIILGFTHGMLTGINTWTYFFICCSLVSHKNNRI